MAKRKVDPYEVIELHDDGKLPFSEIADKLGCSEGYAWRVYKKYKDKYYKELKKTTNNDHLPAEQEQPSSSLSDPSEVAPAPPTNLVEPKTKKKKKVTKYRVKYCPDCGMPMARGEDIGYPEYTWVCPYCREVIP